MRYLTEPWGPLALSDTDPDPLGIDFVVANDVSDQDADGVVTIVGTVKWKCSDVDSVLSEDGQLIPGPSSILSSNAEAWGTNNFGMVCGSAAFAP